jgi:cytochrome c peroxidase
MKQNALLFTTLLLATGGGNVFALTAQEELGKSIFFDDNLSINNNQSCAACHAPEAGWTGPDGAINAGGAVYEGSIPGRFGNRKPPSSAYATPSPILDYVIEKKQALFIGGNFWDGRATGELLGSPAADQAIGPFLNPAEQALPDSACVVYRVCNPTVPADYPVSFEDVWGPGTCAIAWPADIETVCATEGATVTLSVDDRVRSETNYGNIGRTVAAYEDSPAVSEFSSKYDAFLARQVRLSPQERQGLALFRGKGRCANCHVLDAGPNGEPPLFTDFTYDNLGVPKNPENPVYDVNTGFVDLGLGGFLATTPILNPDGTELVPDYSVFADANLGKQKVPTLRNVAKGSCEADPSDPACIVKAYSHNGFFKSLKGIVHFYNTRDALPSCESLGLFDATEAQALANDCWPAPEVPQNVNTAELGNLHMTDAQEDAIVAFMKTLSDGYTP